MRAKIKHAMPVRHTGSIGFRHANASILRCDTGRRLAVLGIALLMVSMFSVAQGWAAGQVDQSNNSSIQNLDSRWIPWIGSWRLISNVTKTGNLVEISKNLLEIKPGDDGRSVVMKGFQDGKVLYDEKNIVVDGSRHPLKDNDCDGWYKYNWSDSGKRLLFDSEVTCSDNRLRTISGISAFTDPSEWVDIQLLLSGEDRMITIRRYRQAGDNQSAPVPRSESHFARIEAGTNFSIDEIIELNDKVAPEVMEAALLEMRKQFEINSDVLLRLSDAGVSPKTVDLMVAISFPDKFTIERFGEEPSEKPVPREPDTSIVYPYSWSPFGMWSYYDPFFPWYWGSPSYLYGYWGWSGYYPYYLGTSVGGGSYGGGSYSGYNVSGGRLVAGKGYSRVTPGSPSSRPRYAQPRGGSRTVSRAGGYGGGSYGGGSYSGGGGYGGGSSGGSSGGGSSGGSSGGGGASASPAGYSGGGGGTAHGR